MTYDLTRLTRQDKTTDLPLPARPQPDLPTPPSGWKSPGPPQHLLSCSQLPIRTCIQTALCPDLFPIGNRDSNLYINQVLMAVDRQTEQAATPTPIRHLSGRVPHPKIRRGAPVTTRTGPRTREAPLCAAPHTALSSSSSSSLQTSESRRVPNGETAVQAGQEE